MPPSKDRQTIKVQAERAVLAAVRLPNDEFDAGDPFGELRSLCEQAGALPVGEIEQFRDRPEAGTYMGRGKLEELRGLCDRLEAEVIVFDHELSPKQIGKIEEKTERKVIDRSELILDIFASRATTHEAKLQVELAQLEYTYPRLRAMWSHLERVVGGSPQGVGTRGPGEQQLEIDRRLVQRRKNMLQRELRQIQERREREVADRTDRHFTVGLVGYTNAGKSTLFNTLTAGGAYADDRLFATLMTRTRGWNLGNGAEAMLSDTVGFVRDLPHHLVASFRATLEQTIHADLLLIVLDISTPGAELRYRTVQRTLDDLLGPPPEPGHEPRVDPAFRKVDAMRPPPERLVLLNKVDRLEDAREILVWQQRVPGSIAISALAPEKGGDGRGLDELTAAVRERVLGRDGVYRIELPMSASRAISTLERLGEVIEREYGADRVVLRVRVGAKVLDDLRAGGVRLESELVG